MIQDDGKDFLIRALLPNSLISLLCRAFCVCISIFVISCASVPQQTYLNEKDLSQIKKVAIVVSAHAPEVSYSRITSGSVLEATVLFIIAAPLLMLPAMSAEAAIRSNIDQKHSKEIGDHSNLSHISDKVAQTFMNQLRKGGCFYAVEFLKDETQSYNKLSIAYYDAVIRLSVRKIILERVAGDNVRLYTHLSGQMECLSSRQILWDREEIVASSEPNSLDYYKENGLKELDVLLERAAKNLSHDFVYLK